MSARRGRVLALDPGAKRIGVSVSDSARTMAFPRPSLEAGAALIGAVRSVVIDDEISVVVVGLPIALSGREGPAAVGARALASALAAALDDLDVEVSLHDERLTTVQAATALSSAGRSARDQRSAIDSAAATVLLEAWLSGR